MLLIAGKIQSNRSLALTQNGVPSYTLGHTQEALHRHRVQQIYWLSFSHNLNPKESVRDQMKACIEDHYPKGHGSEQRQLPRPHEIVTEVWNFITSNKLHHFIKACQRNAGQLNAAYFF